MLPVDYEIFRDAILYSFQKRKTAFLMTDKILMDIHFEKAINPKADQERLATILEMMREKDLVVLNQPQLVALSPKGKQAMMDLTAQQITQIEKGMNERSH